jgi:hypothetical protein
MSETTEGAWVAYNHDGSGVAIFATELDALRHANKYGGMPVIFVHFGEDLHDAERRERECE